MLASHTRTTYATLPADGDIHDRPAQVKSYELVHPPSGPDEPGDDVKSALRKQTVAAKQLRDVFDRLASSDVKVTAHQVNYYDGPAFIGLPIGRLAARGALVRCETLVFTDAILADGYDRGSDKRRPNYLDGTAVLPSDAPPGLGGHAGYRKVSADSRGHENGYYTDTLRRRLSSRGLVLAARDALDHETRLTYDMHDLLPINVRDAAGLQTIGQYNYRLLQVESVTDSNGTVTHVRYNPIGLLEKQYLVGLDAVGNATLGGTEDKPEIVLAYDFLNFARNRQSGGNPGRHPIFVHTKRRTHHASDGISDDTIEIARIFRRLRPGDPEPRAGRGPGLRARRRRRRSAGAAGQHHGPGQRR